MFAPAMFFFMFRILLLIKSGETDDQFQPKYHFRSPRNWLNGPTGPIYYNGYYHMFFQYNPLAPFANETYWGHSCSKDMIHWIRLPDALSPTRSYDMNGIGIGSTTIVNDIPIIMYTGIDENNDHVQCQARPAYPSDPTLSEWIKWPSNPLITKPKGRDPSEGFEDDQENYYSIYGYGTANLGGQALLFISRDFVHWTYLHPFHHNHNAVSWECPDIFNVSNRLVLKASLFERDFWSVGYLDGATKTFRCLSDDLGEYSQLIDIGKFNASKTFFDPINDQRVIVGRIGEDDDQGDRRGWQGIHSLPRSIFLSDDGLQLRTRPVDAVRSLRDQSTHRSLNNIVFSSITPLLILPDVKGNQMEILVNYQFSKHQDLDFGMSVLCTAGGYQRTNIGIMTRKSTDVIYDWDVPGWDSFNVSGIVSAQQCLIACEREETCRAWTFVLTRPLNNNCFLKTAIPHLEVSKGCISGIKKKQTDQEQLVWVYIDRALSQRNAGAAHYPVGGPFWLRTDSLNDHDQWFIQLNIFIDHSVIEVFEPTQGRVAMTTRVYPEDLTAVNVALYVNTAPTLSQSIIVNTLDIWNLTSI